MTKLKLMSGLLAALTIHTAVSGGDPQRRIPIKGEWDIYDADLFRTDSVLDRHRSYTLFNDTDDAIDVVLVEIEGGGRVPRDYFSLQPGYTQQFDAPWNLVSETFTLDLFLTHDGGRVRGITLREVGP